MTLLTELGERVIIGAMDQSSNDASAPRAPKGHLAVRLDERTIARLDALLPRYELPGYNAARGDALRAVILVGLEAEASA